MSGAQKPVQITTQGDHLKQKSSGETHFEEAYTPATAPTAPVKLGSRDYGHDLFDTPFLRNLKAALAGFELPPATRPKPVSKVLPDGDVRLTPTLNLPGREAWRTNLQNLVVSAGAKHDKPTAYFLAGPMGVGKIAAMNRLYAQGVVPSDVVRADSDYLHAMVPEASQLEALGDNRFNDVVHEEASQIGRAAYFQAVSEKRDVLYNSQFSTPDTLTRIQKAKDGGFKRVVIAMVSPVEVAKGRAGGGGMFFSEKMLVEAHRDFAANFDGVVKSSDELVLLMNTGTKLELIASGKGGSLTVTNDRLYQQFRAQKDLKTEGLT